MTAAIRAERRHAGELGEGRRVHRYVPLHYTLAQKSDPGQFHEGQVLVFGRYAGGQPALYCGQMFVIARVAKFAASASEAPAKVRARTTSAYLLP